MKILVAEDEIISRSMLEDMLREWGHTVISVQDGQAAWDVMSANSHVKIFATIREEAYANYESDIRANYYSATVALRYSVDDLRHLIDKLVEFYESLGSFEEFVGLSEVHNSHSQLVEDSFRYLHRHTVGRPRDLVIISHLPHAELRSAYAAARVHVLPSWIETCGLVTLEAALAGCSVVVSSVGYEVDYYRNLVDYCDPADVASIRRAVLSAYENHGRTAERSCGSRSRWEKRSPAHELCGTGTPTRRPRSARRWRTDADPDRRQPRPLPGRDRQHPRARARLRDRG